MRDDLHDRLQQTLGAAYTIERELGGGGMSRVFVASDTSLGRDIVVKVLPPDMAAAVNVGRFKREIALAARLQHPHIVPLLSAGEMDGVPYFTMPYVEGESLRARLSQRGELPIAEAMRVLREVASALAYAHDRGVVHRDVKPDNILVSGGAAMVTDFGVAKALSVSGADAQDHSFTSIGVALGTPAYMAPEQASADPTVDHRADVYALGCVAYELLTGHPPFSGRSPQAMLAAHVQEEPEPIAKRRAGLPPALASLVMRCLAKRPSDRPQSAAEVVHALDAITTPSGGMQPTGATLATTIAPEQKWTGTRVLVLALGCMLAVAGGAFAFWRAGAHGNSASAATSDSAAASSALRSIVVLPFVNVGGDTATEYFADGMTDEVSSALGKLDGVRVASRTSAYAYKGRHDVDVRTVGKALQVGAVLEGTVRRLGNRMRLTAQLTSAKDGLTLWSDSYDRDVKDVFAVQDEVAKAIASALQVRVGSGARLVSKPVDPAIHDLVLRGDYLSNQFTDAGLRSSISLYEQAIAADSTYVAAWTGLANAWGRMADDFIAPKEALSHIRFAFQRALALDSLNAEAHSQRAQYLLWYERNIPEAEREFDKAFALANRGSAYTYGDVTGAYSLLLQLRGMDDSALAVVRSAVAAAPADPTVLGAGAQLVSRGHPREGEHYCRLLLELSPSNACWGGVLLARNQPDSLLQFARSRLALAHDAREVAEMHLLAARALGMLGQKNEARRELASGQAAARGRYMREDHIARAWLALGEKDSAYAWFDRVLDSDGGGVITMPVSTLYAPLHDDPRFRALLQRAGLLTYLR